MPKNYLSGSATLVDFENGGHLINITVEESDFQKIPTRTSKSGVVYRKFTVASRRNGADEYNNTHSVYVESDEELEKSKEMKPFDQKEDLDLNDVPF